LEEQRFNLGSTSEVGVTDAVFGSVVATTGTIVGVVLGYLLSRAQARDARKGEVRSLLEAIRWEMNDAKIYVSASTPMSVVLPTLELVVQRAILAELPIRLRQRLLHTRSRATALNKSSELMVEAIKEGFTENKDVKALLEEHMKLAHGLVPQLEECIAALDDHLKELSRGWLRRLRNRLSRRKTASGTPRS
jgi:hypothetical protein